MLPEDAGGVPGEEVVAVVRGDRLVAGASVTSLCFTQTILWWKRIGTYRVDPTTFFWAEPNHSSPRTAGPAFT